MATETAPATQHKHKPKLFTYTLFLEKNPESKTRKLVRIKDADKFWRDVYKGDQVQFVPDPTIQQDVASIEIEFKPLREPQGAPFGSWETKITDTSPHTVENETYALTAMCYITTTDKVKHECAAGGHAGCTTVNCMKPEPAARTRTTD